MKIRPIFAWYDLWVGLFVDRSKRRLYIFPLPMVGLVIELQTCDRWGKPLPPIWKRLPKIWRRSDGWMLAFWWRRQYWLALGLTPLVAVRHAWTNRREWMGGAS